MRRYDAYKAQEARSRAILRREIEVAERAFRSLVWWVMVPACVLLLASQVWAFVLVLRACEVTS